MVLMACSVDVVLPKALCHLRSTTLPDSNLAMNNTTLSLISIDTDILSEVHSTKI